MAKKKHNNDALVGVGTALLVAGVAAGYFLYGKDGEKHRNKVRGWMLKAKGEILEKMEKLQDVSEDEYHKIIDTVEKKYTKLKDVDPEDVAKLANDLRKHWKQIQAHVEKKKLAKTAKKTVRKAPATKKIAKAKKTVAKKAATVKKGAIKK